MKVFSKNDYLDALVKTAIVIFTYHTVAVVVGITLKWTAFPLPIHLQNPLLVILSLVVMYLVVLFVVKKSK
jgi:hypothetical protein